MNFQELDIALKYLKRKAVMLELDILIEKLKKDKKYKKRITKILDILDELRDTNN